MSNAIVYRNTRTTIPGWVNTLHIMQPRGMAYESDTHFVHYYGNDQGCWVISSGLTATMAKEGTLEQWVIDKFGAEDIQQCLPHIGNTVAGVWRPGLYRLDECMISLRFTVNELRSAEQSLRILIERLDELLLLYIEPSQNGLNSYSHKLRELLILACTEIENLWNSYMQLSDTVPINGKQYTTKDYVKLLSPLHLSDYKTTLKPYSNVDPIRPFASWNSNNPTQSLIWYDAYNQTKHNRNDHFSKANLSNCLSAISANVILHCVRYSPFPLLSGNGTLTALVNQLFSIDLSDCSPTSFYTPGLSLPPSTRGDFACYESSDFASAWTSLDLQI